MIPETDAAQRIAQAIGEYLEPRVITDTYLHQIASKVVAHRGFIRGVFDSLDADPKRIPERDVVLRQDPVAQLDSVEWWSEHAGHLKREYEDALAILERVKSGTLAEYDPDEREADRADDRARVQRQDEHAADAAPKVRAS